MSKNIFLLLFLLILINGCVEEKINPTSKEITPTEEIISPKIEETQIDQEKEEEIKLENVKFKFEEEVILKKRAGEFNRKIFSEEIKNYKVKIQGNLVNNLNQELKDLQLQLRFYNENTLNNELIYSGEKNERDIEFTNHYVNYNQNILVSSKKGFSAKSNNSINLEFNELPYWKQTNSYNSFKLNNIPSWKSYNIDQAELILYNGNNIIQKIPVTLPKAFIQDLRIKPTKLDFANATTSLSLEAVNVEIENKKNIFLNNLKLNIEIKKISKDTIPKEIDFLSKTIQIDYNLVKDLKELRFNNLILKPFSSEGINYFYYVILFKTYIENEYVDVTRIFIECRLGICEPINLGPGPIPPINLKYDLKILTASIYSNIYEDQPKKTPEPGIKATIIIKSLNTPAKIQKPILELTGEKSKIGIHTIDNPLGLNENRKIEIILPYGERGVLTVNLREEYNPTIFATNSKKID